MESETAPRSNGNFLLWTTIGVSLFLPLLAWFALRSGRISVHTSSRKLTTIKFPDGSQLGVLKLGVEKVDDRSETSVRLNYGSSFSSSSWSGHGPSWTKVISTAWEGGTGESQTKWESPGNLLLLVEWSDRTGVYFPTSQHKDGKLLGNSAAIPWQGAAAYLATPSGTGAHPEFAIELADGAGGWITGSGPGVFSNGQKRGALAFPAWPRTTKTLVFRALRPGHSEQRFSVANPLASPPVSAGWSSAPLPQTVNSKRFDLILDSASLTPTPQCSSTMSVDLRLVSKLAGSGGLHLAKLRLDGSLGSSCHYPYEGDGPTWRFPFPTDEVLFRLTASVDCSNSFAFAESEVEFLADADVSTSGVVSLAKTHSPAGFLASKLSVHAATLKAGKLDIAIRFNAKNGSHELNSDRSRPVVFIGNEPTSAAQGTKQVLFAGVAEPVNGYEISFTLSPPPIGQIRVGMAKLPPMEEVEFYFDKVSLK